jgi:hypothetical protein
MPTTRRATSEWTLWVVALSCALHPAEELLTGWLPWARETLGIAMPVGIFVVRNCALVALAVGLARAGWRRPVASLVVPSATLTNALLFHLLPTALQGRAAPGVYTAALLYVPFSSWALVGAARDGVPRRAIGAGVAGGVGLALGVVLAARWLTGVR